MLNILLKILYIKTHRGGIDLEVVIKFLEKASAFTFNLFITKTRRFSSSKEKFYRIKSIEMHQERKAFIELKRENVYHRSEYKSQISKFMMGSPWS